MAQTILVVDDDPDAVDLICEVLDSKEFRTLKAAGGLEALKIVAAQAPDLVLLDIMMPVMDGKETCRRICALSTVPVIMLSGRAEPESKIECLQSGAEDYVVKPFNSDELVARIRTVLRRHQPVASYAALHQFKLNALEIDFPAQNVTVAGERIELTPLEFRLLAELVLNAGKTCTYAHLLQQVWGTEYVGANEYVYVYMGHLRQKIERDSSISYIQTVHGVGYMFKNK
jgi:two-component system, OmpR family, KDP operon response regulator KdpE